MNAAVHEDIGGLQAKCKVLFECKACHRRKAVYDNAYHVMCVTYRHGPFHECSAYLLVSHSR